MEGKQILDLRAKGAKERKEWIPKRLFLVRCFLHGQRACPGKDSYMNYFRELQAQEQGRRQGVQSCEGEHREAHIGSMEHLENRV